jgi:hypothetical protein
LDAHAPKWPRPRQPDGRPLRPGERARLVSS